MVSFVEPDFWLPLSGSGGATSSPPFFDAGPALLDGPAAGRPAGGLPADERSSRGARFEIRWRALADSARHKKYR